MEKNWRKSFTAKKTTPGRDTQHLLSLTVI
jgi:hypothetical protein